MKHLAILITSLLLLAFTSCSEYYKVSKSRDYMVKYESAKEMFAVGKYNTAALVLGEVITTLKGTEYGEESLYLLAMSHYRSRDYNSAKQYFKKYYQTYPRGKFTEQARFYTGKSLYKSVPEVRLDQTATYEAVTEYQQFLEAYPTTAYAAEVQHDIFALQDRLVAPVSFSALFCCYPAV